MLVCWRQQTKTWKRLFIVVTVALGGLWWIALASRPDYVYIDTGQSLSLVVDENDIQLRLRSPDGATCLRGTLGSVSGGVLVAGSLRSCPVVDSSYDGACAEMKVPTSGDDESMLELEVAYSGDVDCYTVKWRPQTYAASKDLYVIDCYTLDDALWYGGGQVYDQRWPINAQRSELQPHVTGDYLIPEWREKPSYGKYGSLAEPYWLSSSGVGIIVDDRIPLSSSFNAGGDGRLCLKGDRTTIVRNHSSDVAEILLYTICRGKDIAAVHQTISELFFPRPKAYPDVRMMREPIWSTWARYKVNVNQSNVEEMAEQILHYNFPYRYLFIPLYTFLFNYLLVKLQAVNLIE